MTMEVNISYKSSFYKKTNKKNYTDALKEALKETILYADTEARKKAPIRTGNLRAHHSTRVSDEMAELVNNCGYASYVAFGTSKQSAQNYPLEIIKDIQQKKLIPKLIEDKLKSEGVL